MVSVWIGDTRQNESRLELIRAGDAVRTVCWLNGEPFCRLEANSYGLKTEKSCWKGGSR